VIVAIAVLLTLSGKQPPANATEGRQLLAGLFNGNTRLPRLADLLPIAPGGGSAPTPAPAPPQSGSGDSGDIPGLYRDLYVTAGRDYRLPWTVLAGIGKVESDHGRSQLPGVHSGSNSAGACGPMQIGCVPGSAAGNSWATYGRGSPYSPGDAIPAAARYLVGHGAHQSIDQAIYGYNHSSAYVANVKGWARRYGGTV